MRTRQVLPRSRVVGILLRKGLGRQDEFGDLLGYLLRKS